MKGGGHSFGSWWAMCWSPPPSIFDGSISSIWPVNFVHIDPSICQFDPSNCPVGLSTCQFDPSKWSILTRQFINLTRQNGPYWSVNLSIWPVNLTKCQIDKLTRMVKFLMLFHRFSELTRHGRRNPAHVHMRSRQNQDYGSRVVKNVRLGIGFW